MFNLSCNNFLKPCSHLKILDLRACLNKFATNNNYWRMFLHYLVQCICQSHHSLSNVSFKSRDKLTLTRHHMITHVRSVWLIRMISHWVESRIYCGMEIFCAERWVHGKRSLCRWCCHWWCWWMWWTLAIPYQVAIIDRSVAAYICGSKRDLMDVDLRSR